MGIWLIDHSFSNNPDLQPECRLLCLVRNVENSDNIIRGLCGACGKLDELNQFKKVDEKLFCCQKEPSAAAKLHIVMHVYDHTNNVDDDLCTTVVVSGLELVKGFFSFILKYMVQTPCSFHIFENFLWF